MNKETRIIVIGTSAGGYAALKELFNEMTSDLNAVFLVVQHTASDATNYFAEVLQKVTSLKVQYAEQDMVIEAGNVYLSVPDYHLLINGERLFLSKGPTENLSRPAIDPLFRTAAANYGNRVIGIILTGLLNDGTSGLLAIKNGNGITIVQNPKDADYPEMPNFALQTVQPDWCSNLAEMSNLIMKLLHLDPPEAVEIPKYVKQEASIAMKIASRMRLEEEIGDQVPIGCPECQGPMWLMEHEKFFPRYRCHTGHGYTTETLLQGQTTRIEESLWVALRTLEERIYLLKKSILINKERGFDSLSRSLKQKLQETERSRDILKEAMDMPPPKFNDRDLTTTEIGDCQSG